MKICTLLFALVALPLAHVAADKKPGEVAAIQSVVLKSGRSPSAKITAVIKVKLNQGYHVHSSQPSEANFIATVLSLETPAGLKVGPINYPKGKSVKVAGLDKPLSIYEDQFEVSVPLTFDPKTTPPLVIPATLQYQACEGARCYPPARLKFDLKLRDRE